MLMLFIFSLVQTFRYLVLIRGTACRYGYNSLLAMMNLLGGGNFREFSVFAMGVGPYITGFHYHPILSMDVIPALSELSKQGQMDVKTLIVIRVTSVSSVSVPGVTMTYAFDKSSRCC